jgi:8-amino-7-oxononanoate synthase
MSLFKKISDILNDLKQTQSFRYLRSQNPKEDLVLDLSHNDYLSIAQNTSVREQFKPDSDFLYSASSSRLLSGNHIYYDRVEQKLSDLYNGRAALFFNSGYHLNIGVLPTITSKNDLILSDKLVHASLIEGMRLSYAKTIRYKHLDYEHLEALIAKYQNEYDNIFIVSESVYSMDGDIADLDILVKLKQKYKAYLYVDEAHAVGVCGKSGLGVSEEKNLIKDIDFIVGTMGKALASVGAYLICNADIKSYLINKCKSLIYTTALPPINMAWTVQILSVLPDLNKERSALSEIQAYFRKALSEHKISFLGESHIMAIIVGSNEACLDLASNLLDEGIRVQAVRPPTVPQGTSRIRISLNSSVSKNDIDLLIDKLKSIKN